MCVPYYDKNCKWDPTDPAANVVNQFLYGLAEDASKAAAHQIRDVVVGWLAIPTPDVEAGQKVGHDGATTFVGVVPYLRGYTSYFVTAIAVFAILLAAIRLALRRNGKEAGEFGKDLVAMVMLAGLGIPAVSALTWIGDEYSKWIIDEAAGKELGARATLLTPAVGAAALSGVGLIAILGISLMMWLTAITQVVLLLGRGAALVLLAGLMPLAGAAGLAGGGARATRDKYVSWLVALVLYKPVAATIYAAGFWALGKGNDFTTIITGLVMFAMAIVALPALMRLVTPAMAAISAGGGGGGALAAVGVGGQLASGAMRLGDSSGKGRGKGGGAGGGAPTGAMSSPPSATSGATPAAGGAAPAAGGASAGGAAAGGAMAAAGPVGTGVAVAGKVAQAGPKIAKATGGTAATGATGGDGG